MKNFIRSFTLFVIASLILASCLPSDPATNVAPVVQPTQNLTDRVGVELAVSYDTAAVYNTVGQIVRFKYSVKMVKNDLTDNLPANVVISGITATCPPINTINNLNDRFDAGEVLECTGDYILTQADLDRGSVSNVATANVYTVNSNTVTTNVPTASPKALSLTKSASTTTYSSTGQQITFTYTVKNSGTVQLGPDQFRVADSGINNNSPFACGNPDATLAPGATFTCNATYLVTAADINAPSISHNASVTGAGVTSPTVPLALTKGSPSTASGSNIQHTVRDGEWLWQIARCYSADPEQTVKANPQVVDPRALSIGTVVTVPNIGTVGNRQVHSPPELCVQFHTVQSGDTWTTIAQKYGADPGLTQYVNSNIMTTGKQVKVPLYTAGLNIPLIGTTTTPTSPSTTALGLTVTPSATVYSQVDQRITFNYVIKNNGTTTLGPTQFVINDSFMNPTAFNCGGASTTLTPGATVQCSNDYVVRQADIGVVNIQFSTTASGTGVPTSVAIPTTLTKGAPQITLTVATNSTTYSQAGQTIAFSYTIKNTGSTTLGPTQFVINDAFMNPTAFNCGAPNTTLTAGATVQCTNNYQISQADMAVVNIQFSTNAGGTGVPTSANVPTTLTKQ